MTPRTADAAPSDDALALERAHSAVQEAITTGRPPQREKTGVGVIDALVAGAQAARIDIPPERVTAARRVGELTLERAGEILGLVLRRVDLTTPGSWWKSDSSAIVGRTVAGWVALVPRRGRMWLVTPNGRDSDTPVKVRRDHPPFIDGHGWQVCSALPARPCNRSDLKRLTWTGGGRRDATLVGAAVLAAAILSMLVPMLSGRIVGELIPTHESGRIIAVAGVLILVSAAAAIVLAIQVLICQRLIVRIDQRLTIALYSRLFRLSGSFHRSHLPGELAQRVSSLEAVSLAFASAIPTVIAALSLIAGSVVVLFWLDSLVGLITVLLCGLIVSLGFPILRRLAHISGEYNDTSLELAGQTFAMLAGISKIRAAQAEGRMNARWLLMYAHQQRWALFAGRMRIRLALLAAIPAAVVSLTIVIVFGAGVDSGGLGAFTSMTSAATQIAGAMTALLVAAATVVPVVPLLAAIRPLLRAVPEVSPASAEEVGPLSGRIVMREVSFSYAAGARVLQSVNIEISPGSFVAVVGPSGSGKTTLIKLLLGLETPSQGVISYDGRSLERLDKRTVRKQIGVVPQNAALAAGSILENILFGRAELEEEDAWRAAEAVGLAADIRQMPMGMRTVVSDGAATFSGGQRQRIMLARAVARNPRVLVLDEATSALDNISQAAVAAALVGLGTTRIVVAHRLSTIRNADHVVVLVGGRVAEQGPFEQLIAADGEFARLVRLQEMR